VAVLAAVVLPDSLRELAEFVDAHAAGVLAEGHAAGVDAAGRALDRVGDNTTDMVERATERRVLELAFERNAAGQAL
jgi:phosphate uptake regulator